MLDAKAQARTVVIRCALTVVCIAGGFVFPLLFLLAAFLAWTVYSDLTGPKPTEPPADAWYVRRWTATAEDPEWKSYFLPYCESPAETAFLEAMITEYKLLPSGGKLVGSGVELDLQVEHKPYRLDFCANKWLVIEIDGAAWHSSPEAVEHDRIRDEFFIAKGFSVVRIPAKIVFNTPKKAVEMVRAAIARGRPSQKAAAPSTRVSVTHTLLNAAKSVDKFVTDIDAHVTKASAIQEAMRPSNQTFSSEKIVIDSALETAKRKVALEAQLAADPNLREHFDAAHAELEELLDSTRSAQPPTKTTIDISPMSWPATHPDTEIGTAILEAYFKLTGDRKRYFDEARQQILKDPRLSPHVQSHLESLGCHAVWTEISKKKEPFSLDAFLKEIEAKGSGSSETGPPPS